MPPVNTNYGAGTIVALAGGNAIFGVLLANGSVRDWGTGQYLGYGSAANIGDGPGELGYGNTVQIGDHNNEMPPAPVQAF